MKHFWILGLLLLVGCTSASRGKFMSIAQPHKVEMYSGGELVRTWVSTGLVHNEESSDGFYFVEEGTGALIRVTGDVVITRD